MGSSAMIDKFKNLIGFGDLEDEYEEEVMQADEEERRTTAKPTYNKKQKVVPMRGNTNSSKIVVLKPKCFNDSMLVADELKERRPVVINVGSLDTDEARRVVDFVAGTAYGLNGNMQKIAGGIFIATPAHVDILGEVLEDSGAGFEWSMF